MAPINPALSVKARPASLTNNISRNAMKPSRRRFLHLAAGVAALPAASRVARAENYPSRPVRIIVGFAPGGGNDVVARLMGQGLSERLGQQFVIENRPGAGTNIAAEMVVRAAPDGYTLFLTNAANAINATLYDNLNLNFDFIRDIAPVGGVIRAPQVMVVNPAVPAKTIPEFIAYAKANPGKINMASAGNGGPTHLAGELFKKMAAVDLVHVPYRGNGPALADLLGGQVQVMFPPTTAPLPFIQSGSLRVLGVSTSARLAILPDIPTIGEFLPGYEASNFYGLGAPKNTPAEIIDTLNKEFNIGLTDPAEQQKFADLGDVVTPMTAAAFGNLVADETKKWAEVIKFANVKLD
jgi:tripartite-type tricarboxylate transporter receptor subunit TctC